MTVRVPGINPAAARNLEVEFQRIDRELQRKATPVVLQVATTATLPAPVKDGFIRVATSADDTGTIAVSPNGTYWYDLINAVTVA